MLMKVAPYTQIKNLIRTGDLIAWNGTGHNIVERFYSLGIRWVTGPVTHSSTAMWSKFGNNDVLQVWESAAMGQIFSSLDRNIAKAAEDGWTHCWWFPLSAERSDKLDVDALTDYAVRKVEEGTSYDIRQAIRSALDRRERQHNAPDDSSLFCSESHMFALLAGGAVDDCNPSEAHPLDLVQFDMHELTYYQIWYKDEPMELPGVGTVPVDEWDV